MSSKAAINKLLHVHRILCETYGAPFPYFSNRQPIDHIVSAMLSHRTRNKTTAAAYRALKAAFDSWEDFIAAPHEEVVPHIKSVTYAEQKARRIPQALQYVKDHNNGQLSLDFLADLSVAEAREWLEQIPGVGAKTSAAVLNFSTLRLPALVVDTHHHRVAERIGFVAPKTPLSKVAYQLQALLPKDWNGRDYYDHHEALMYHGQRCCHYRNPECERCPVRDVCAYAQPAADAQPSLFE